MQPTPKQRLNPDNFTISKSYGCKGCYFFPESFKTLEPLINEKAILKSALVSKFGDCLKKNIIYILKS